MVLLRLQRLLYLKITCGFSWDLTTKCWSWSSSVKWIQCIVWSLPSEFGWALRVHWATWPSAWRIAGRNCNCCQDYHQESEQSVFHFRNILLIKRFWNRIILQIYSSFPFKEMIVVEHDLQQLLILKVLGFFYWISLKTYVKTLRISAPQKLC